MHGNDRARRVLIAALLLSLAASAIYPEDSDGAVVIWATFWLYGLAIVGFAVAQLVLRRRYGSGVPVLKWVLLAVSVTSLYAFACLERHTPPAQLAAFLFVGTLLALFFLGIRDTFRRLRAAG